MVDQPQRPPLNYFGPPPRSAAVVYDAETRRWLAIRRVYRVGLYVLIAPIAVPVFSNLIKFGKPTSLSPADFVQEAQTECVPTVRAIKKYQQDTGKLPDDIQNVVPKYLPSDPVREELQGTTFIDWARWPSTSHRIVYDFNPATEGWSVIGPFANGPIPLPMVTLLPPIGPTSQP